MPPMPIYVRQVEFSYKKGAPREGRAFNRKGSIYIRPSICQTGTLARQPIMLMTM